MCEAVSCVRGHVSSMASLAWLRNIIIVDVWKYENINYI